MKPSRGAALLGLSVRQFRRLRQRFTREGDAAVIHGLRGRRSNNAKPEQLRRRVLERAREPVFEGFGPTLLAEKLSEDRAIGPLNRYTFRSWMIADGLWKVRRRGARHRKARPRRAAFGELIQWDSSEHAWFEDRCPGRLVLIQMHDDATNRLLMARFVPKDDGAANRQIAIDYLRRWGRPVAFYTDKAGHFGQETRAVSSIPREEREAKLTQSIIRRALQALHVELILANSPQAKGRVERNFGTSQDRLVKELRLRGISTIEEANRFLEEVYIPFWNQRFAVEPADPRDAHRPLPKTADLERLFADTVERTIAADFTIRYRNQRLQIPKEQAKGIRPKHKIVVERRLDGSTRFRWQHRYLTLEPVADPVRVPSRGTRVSPQVEIAAHNSNGARHLGRNQRRKPKAPPRPGPDHPWRTSGVLLANPAAVAKHRVARALQRPAPGVASAPSAPRPDSPKSLGTSSKP